MQGVDRSNYSVFRDKQSMAALSVLRSLGYRWLRKPKMLDILGFPKSALPHVRYSLCIVRVAGAEYSDRIKPFSFSCHCCCCTERVLSSSPSLLRAVCSFTRRLLKGVAGDEV